VQNGRRDIAPYWRVVRKDGSLKPNFPGGVDAQSAHLKEEGHSILPGKGRKAPRAKDFEKHLVNE
jgi:hypothetical protein